MFIRTLRYKDVDNEKILCTYSQCIFGATEYIFYCKRAILFLSSSKILTPHPLLRPASLRPPPATKTGVHTRRAERGMGGQYFGRRDNRIALLQMVSLRLGPTVTQNAQKLKHKIYIDYFVYANKTCKLILQF